MSIPISAIVKGIGALSSIFTSKTDNAQDAQASASKALNEESGRASLSTEGITRSKMPPPPEEMDFTKLSDEDLMTYLQQMFQITGIIPGIEKGTTVSDLTVDQLQTARATLVDMSKQRGTDQIMGKAPPRPMDISKLSNEDLLALLENIKAGVGSIPGVENSESKEVSSLTTEELQNARNTLMEMMQQRMQAAQQAQVMSYAASAYTATRALAA